MLRADLTAILNWIPKNSNILDLGCGDGTLLEALIEQKNVTGYGLETNPDLILSCINKNVSVIEQNINKGLNNFSDQSFDMVIMTQALQEISNPHLVLNEVLRVGKEALITFPNFGNWRNRIFLGLRGRMPVSNSLPYAWYETPNIHLCTFKDFEVLCKKQSIEILQRSVVDQEYKKSRLLEWLPNLFGEIALYRISKK